MALNFARNEEQRQFKIKELGELLNEQYLKQRREPGRVEKTSFAPSGIGYGKGTCPRFWFYSFTGYDAIPDEDAQSIASMAYGTEAGKRIAELFRTAGILIDDEVEAELADPPVRGYIDVIVNWNGEEVIGEVKTTRPESFAIRETTMSPPAYNLIQLLLYMHIKKRAKGFLIYENKATQEFITIPVVMNDENKAFLEYVLQWLRDVRANYEAGTLPTRPFPSIKNKVCKDCPARRTCWDGPDEGVLTLPILDTEKMRG